MPVWRKHARDATWSPDVQNKESIVRNASACCAYTRDIDAAPIAEPDMLLSKACEYGLRAALHLASLDKGGYVSIRTISDTLDISFPFLTKIFQQLNEAGLSESHRGPSGGVAFTKPTDAITLYEVVVAIDGEKLFEECVLGLPNCGTDKPCPIHDRWAEERSRLERLFKRNTLDDMASRIKDFDVRLVATPS